MNGEIVPAAVAAGGGAALAGGIYLYERRRDEAMRASRARLELRFPIGLTATAVQAGLTDLAGLPSEAELVAELVAAPTGISHGLWAPARSRASVAAMLNGAIPALRYRQRASAAADHATFAVRLFASTPVVLRSDDVETSSRALLLGLTTLKEGECVVLRWALRSGPAPRLSTAPSSRRQELRPRDREWRRKAALPGFRVAGLLLVRAGGIARARTLARTITDQLQSRVLFGSLRMTSERGNRSLASLPRVGRTSGWLSAAELASLLGFPLGAERVSGVAVGAARELPVPRSTARTGRRLFVGREVDGHDRPVALTAEAAKHHVAVLGPSGTGKSALLARGVLDDIERGHAGLLVDPKADLLATILDRIPARHADRIVVLDPASPLPVPGLDVLGGGDPDLRADVLVGALRSVTPEWGIRSEVYSRLALRTISEIAGATLADLPRLFAEPGFRTQAVARINDPLLTASWQAYDALSVAERAQHIQAPMARLTALIGRPALRAVLAQPQPKLDVAQLFQRRGWLMVSLSPGTLGEPAARLLGSVLMYVVWNAIEARVSVPEADRHPIFLYVDELASLSELPFSFELLAERGRGLGAGLTVAAQSLARIPESMRAALLGNVGTVVSFRAPSQEAARLAHEFPGLSADDLMALDRFQVAARVSTGAGSGVAVMTGRTEPLPSATGQAARIREHSAERYGVSRAELRKHWREGATVVTDIAAPGRGRRRP